VKNKASLILLEFLFLSGLLLLFPSFLLAVENPIQAKVTVSASIGEPKLTLFGYSSAQSLVQLSGQRVEEEVIAQDNGYFLFDRIFLPYPNPEYPELCLNAIDTQSRISFPVCLPTLPIGPFDLTVGPVLLPPTFSLEKGDFLPQEQIKAEGLTIPGTDVNLFLANDASNKKGFLARLFRLETLAYTLPQYQIKADQNGYFEFSLPTVKANNWRLFASSQFQGSPTPKSNTLNFKVLSWWEWLWLSIANLLWGFLRLLRPYWWLILICLETILVVWLLALHKKNKRKSAKIKLHALR
jgi:hypothetical protein